MLDIPTSGRVEDIVRTQSAGCEQLALAASVRFFSEPTMCGTDFANPSAVPTLQLCETRWCGTFGWSLSRLANRSARAAMRRAFLTNSRGKVKQLGFFFAADLAFVFNFQRRWKGLKLQYSRTGVKTEEIRKGRIWAGVRDIWRICLEILPLHKSRAKRRKPNKKPRTT